jgi:hypothetical protein
MHRGIAHSTFSTLLLAVVITAVLVLILVMAMPPKLF